MPILLNAYRLLGKIVRIVRFDTRFVGNGEKSQFMRFSVPVDDGDFHGQRGFAVIFQPTVLGTGTGIQLEVVRSVREVGVAVIGGFDEFDLSLNRINLRRLIDRRVEREQVREGFARIERLGRIVVVSVFVVDNRRIVDIGLAEHAFAGAFAVRAGSLDDDFVAQSEKTHHFVGNLNGDRAGFVDQIESDFVDQRRSDDAAHGDFVSDRRSDRFADRQRFDVFVRADADRERFGITFIRGIGSGNGNFRYTDVLGMQNRFSVDFFKVNDVRIVGRVGNRRVFKSEQFRRDGGDQFFHRIAGVMGEELIFCVIIDDEFRRAGEIKRVRFVDDRDRLKTEQATGNRGFGVDRGKISRHDFSVEFVEPVEVRTVALRVNVTSRRSVEIVEVVIDETGSLFFA